MFMNHGNPLDLGVEDSEWLNGSRSSVAPMVVGPLLGQDVRTKEGPQKDQIRKQVPNKNKRRTK